MLVILSPAKTMNMASDAGIPSGTAPLFANEAVRLASRIGGLSCTMLRSKLKISDKLAKLNYDRYQAFDREDAPVKQAITAYDGSVFRALNPGSFSAEDFRYAQNCLRIVSPLYGPLRPLDLIRAYRLAFTFEIPGMEGNLYDYWRPRLTDSLIRDTQAAGGVLLNLASLDILPALDIPRLRRTVRLLSVEFGEFRNGKYGTVRTYAKMARGKMAGYIVRNRIEEPERLHSFLWENFRYDAGLSNDERYVFSRKRD